MHIITAYTNFQNVKLYEYTVTEYQKTIPSKVNSEQFWKVLSKFSEMKLIWENLTQ